MVQLCFFAFLLIYNIVMQRLGRSKDAKEYVRKGYDKGSAEVIVSGGPEGADYRIEREITKDGKSQFKINGVCIWLML